MTSFSGESFCFRTVMTPLGPLRLEATGRGLRRVLFPGEGWERRAGNSARGDPKDPAWAVARRHLTEATRQLEEYFRGRLKEFTLTLDLRGSDHQIRIWKILLRIPYGRTLTYGDIARGMGNRRSARAVGRGCATNPLPVVIPCHRVLSGTGSLQGFGGGLWRKRALLELEQGQAALPLRGERSEGPGT